MIHVSAEQVYASKKLSQKNMEITYPVVYEVCDTRFVIMPQVFSPLLFPSANIYYPVFPFQSEERFLEIGCGAGYGAILASLHGAVEVVATDINPAAVSNTRLNVALHDIEDRVTVIESDLFAQVDGHFSTIYWNHPFITAPPDFQYDSIVERAIFDPGYEQLVTFLDIARSYLLPGGRVLLGLADVGGLDYFRMKAHEFGYTEVELVRKPGVEGNTIEVTLHELRLV